MRRFAEPVSIKLLALVAAALGGTGLVLFGSASVPTWSLRGDGLAVLALLFFSANMVLAKEARQKVGALEFQAVTWIVALAVGDPSGRRFRRRAAPCPTRRPGCGSWSSSPFRDRATC